MSNGLAGLLLFSPFILFILYFLLGFKKVPPGKALLFYSKDGLPLDSDDALPLLKVFLKGWSFSWFGSKYLKRIDLSGKVFEFASDKHKTIYDKRAVFSGSLEYKISKEQTAIKKAGFYIISAGNKLLEKELEERLDEQIAGLVPDCLSDANSNEKKAFSIELRERLELAIKELGLEIVSLEINTLKIMF
jgi:hypothetical protein